MLNNPPAPPRLAPRQYSAQLPDDVFQLPPTYDDSTTTSGLSELSSLETSPNSSPRDTHQQTDEKRTTQGRQ